ncbi:MAG: YraN family protein [Woeseiaceae bacterium]
MAPTVAESVGLCAEQLALEHLQSSGLELIERNFRCRVGELDLVMLDAMCLVFVEVRCRKSAGNVTSSRFPTAVESIGPNKQRKLTKAALYFLARHKAYRNHTVRFDVVAFDGPSPDRYRLQWIKDAFRPGG